MKFRLKEMRLKAGMTQEEAAQAMGVTRRMVSSWECEERKIRFDDAIRLAKVYGCTTDELAGLVIDKKQDDMRELYYSVTSLSEEGQKSVQDMISFTQYKEKNDK